MNNDTEHHGGRNTGILAGLTAYTMWGFFPLYFMMFDGVAPVEFVAYRVLWSLGWLSGGILLTQRWAPLRDTFRSPGLLAMLFPSAICLATNWGLFVYAVTHEQVAQSALGYFINPLVSVFLGMVVLGERLRSLQWTSIGIAAFGVAVMTVMGGAFPWLALSLASTFGLYGLLRKIAANRPNSPVDAVVGLATEMVVAAPIATLFLVWWISRGMLTANSWNVQLLLVACGPVTISPLLLFAVAARRLPLSMVGMLQYICPTLHFLLAVLNGEEFTAAKIASFVLIWIAVALFIYDSYRAPAPATLPTPEEEAAGDCH